MKGFYKILFLKLFLISFFAGEVYFYQGAFQDSPQQMLNKSFSSLDNKTFLSDVLFTLEEDDDEVTKKDFSGLKYNELTFDYSFPSCNEHYSDGIIISSFKRSFFLSHSDLSPPRIS